MVKAYLRYEHDAAHGVVASAPALAFTGADGRALAAAALEAVALTDARTGAAVATLTPPPAASGAPAREVTALAAHGGALAAGAADGRVRLWDAESRACEATLAGHASAVTALAFDASGATLASGAGDGDVVLWDAVAGAGLARLRGHAGPVTGLVFLPGNAGLASASRDGSIRVWHGETRACTQTVATGGELWCLALSPTSDDDGGPLLAAAGAGGDVALFRVACGGAAGAAGTDTLVTAGALRRSAPDRAAALTWTVGKDGRALLAAASAGRVVDLWRARDGAAARKHAARRVKRKRDKETKKARQGDEGGEEDGDGGDDDDAAATAAAPSTTTTSTVDVEAIDALEPLPALRLKHRVRGALFAPARARGRKGAARLALALANNTVECWDMVGDAAPERGLLLDSGHRTGVRATALAADGRTALACAGDAATLWNVDTGARLRTLDLGSVGLAVAWAPGGRHAVVGGRGGEVLLVDCASGDSAPAGAPHAGPVWAVEPLPDGSGFLTASADKDVRFWEWEVDTGGDDEDAPRAAPAPRALRARHVRTLRLTDDALAARPAPDGSVVAVALLDATIQVFHADTLKHRLALYGHALPALALDISTDGTLLVSGGADKAVRVWGLDFGDCHRAMRGHADSVMAVAFVPRTHHVFTGGKDGTVRYWDADAWAPLLTLADPAAEVWCLALSPDGGTLVAGGADRALRVYRRSDEPFFIEEEAERRLEAAFDEGEAAAVGAAAAATAGAGAAAASRPTADALTGADALAEALDAADAEDARLAAAAAAGAPPPPPSPLLLGRTPDAHVGAALAAVRPADLEAALLCTPLADALRLAGRLRALLAGGDPAAPGKPLHPSVAGPELLVRASNLLVRAHAPSLAGSRDARAALGALRGPLRAAARRVRDSFGEAEAALKVLGRRAAAAAVVA